jgi:hypothetical protein
MWTHARVQYLGPPVSNHYHGLLILFREQNDWDGMMNILKVLLLLLPHAFLSLSLSPFTLLSSSLLFPRLVTQRRFSAALQPCGRV